MPVELILDDSMWPTAPNVQKHLQKDDSTNLFFDSPKDLGEQRSISQYIFYPSLSKRVLKRNYQKLQELLSLLGGFASFLRLFFGLVAEFFLKKKCFLYFTNKFYQSKRKKTNTYENKEIDLFSNRRNIQNLKITELIEKKLGVINCKNEGLELEKCVPSNNNDFESFKNKRIEKTKEKLNKIDDSPSLKVSFFEYIIFSLKSTFCINKLNKKEKIISQCKINYIQQVDLFKILKKIKEIEILKEILLTPHQQELFSGLVNQFIYYENSLPLD